MPASTEKEQNYESLDEDLSTMDSIDIIPMVSAVHLNSIYSVCATKNSKWVFTGSEDGFIRKYDLISSMNGSTVLTGVQKQGLADSIQKGGHILSAWENEDSSMHLTHSSKEIDPIKKEKTSQDQAFLANAPAGADISTVPELTKSSPVYSLDVQAEGVWLVGGTENGNINLWSVRHEEGKLQHVFRGAHKGPVSVLKIASGEKSLITGSWDKTIKLWSLESGNLISEYKDPTSHVTSLSLTTEGPGNAPLYLASSFDGTIYIYDVRKQGGLVMKVPASASNSPPWTLSTCWSANGNKIFVARRNSTVDEFDFKMKARYSRTYKMPHGSGSVYCVESLPNNRHLIVASYDNIRLWDLDHQSVENNLTSTQKNQKQDPVLQENLFPDENPFDMNLFGSSDTFHKTEKKGYDVDLLDQDLLSPTVPFTIIPGHHGGAISSILLTGKYLVSASGNKGYDGNSNNLCLIYDIVKLAKPSL